MSAHAYPQHPHAPFAVGVASRGSIGRLVKKMGATHLLTLLDPGRNFYKPHRIAMPNFLRVNFEDDTDPSSAFAPNESHILHIITWARQIPSGARLAVNCEAGVSRSTAAAIIALVANDMAPDEAGHYVMAVRDCARPNVLMMSYADRALNLNGALIKAGEDLRSRGPGRSYDR